MTDRRLQTRVRIVGAGLLGTSIGLALTERGVDVTLDDLSPTAVKLAVDYGAGRPASADRGRHDEPGLIVVCVPPDVTAVTVAGELSAHPDALVTDVVMPRMSGPEAAHAIQSRRPETRVLFMSGFADSGGSSRDLPEGAPFLAKPFTPDELLGAVARLF